MKEYEKIILGIDPGTNILGYGLIGISKNEMELISTGVVRMQKLENHQLKLKKIFESITHIIDEYLPDEVAVEAPFFGKNVQSMLKLGRAQGVAMAAALVKDLPIATGLLTQKRPQRWGSDLQIPGYPCLGLTFPFH